MTRRQLSDRELVEEVTENPYMQYFLGYHLFSEDPPFDCSTVHHFRKRFSVDIVNEVNELIAIVAAKEDDKDSEL